jgi:group I intron endonuclease
MMQTWPMNGSFGGVPAVAAVYRITNLLNAKCYIGSALNLKGRIERHCRLLALGRHHNKHLQHSWRLYGAGVFTLEVIELIADAATLLLREQYHLDLVPSGNRYNVCSVAGSTLGVKLSSEQRAKISAVASKRSHEMLKMLAIAQRGVAHSKEHRAKIAVGMKAATERRRATTGHPRCVHCGGYTKTAGRSKLGCKRFTCCECGRSFTKYPNGFKPKYQMTDKTKRSLRAGTRAYCAARRAANPHCIYCDGETKKQTRERPEVARFKCYRCRRSFSVGARRCATVNYEKEAHLRESLSRIRRCTGMSQRSIAIEVGVTPEQLSRFNTGFRYACRMECGVRIEAWLNENDPVRRYLLTQKVVA